MRIFIIKKMYYVYVLIDRENIFYVGKGSTRGIYNRVDYHKKYYKHNKNKKLSNKIKKLNGEFDVQIVYESENEQDCFEYEKNLIESIGLQNLCNLTLGGEGPSGWEHTEEARKKIADSNRVKIECPHCKKIGSIRNMKRYHFDNCKKITGIKKHVGHKISEETKEKIRNAISGSNNFWFGKVGNRKGSKHSQDSIDKMKQKLKGKLHSEETKLKIKKALKEYKEKNPFKHSEETKQKLKKPQKKMKCPHCGLIGGLANMRRYHFDNCKKFL